MVPAPKIRSCPFCCIIAIGKFCPKSEAYLCSNPEICPPKTPPMSKDVAGKEITKTISIKLNHLIRLRSPFTSIIIFSRGIEMSLRNDIWSKHKSLRYYGLYFWHGWGQKTVVVCPTTWKKIYKIQNNKKINVKVIMLLCFIWNKNNGITYGALSLIV